MNFVELTSCQKRAAIIVASILLFYLLFGFIGAPFIVRGVLEKKVAAAIGRKVSVEQIRVNPLCLSITLRGLSVREHGDVPFVALGEAYANLQMASLFKWALVLKTIRLNQPDIHLMRTGDATFNFSDIGRAQSPQASEAEDEAESGGFGVVVNDLQILDGRVALEDRVVSVNHRVEGFNLGVVNFSSHPSDVNDTTDFTLSARINDADVTINGQGRPFRSDHDIRASIHLANVTLSAYLPYMSLPPNLAVQSFNLETSNEIGFSVLADGQPELVVAGQTTLSHVRLTDGQGDLFVYHPHLAFDLLPSTVLTGELRFGKIESTNSQYVIRRLASGDLYMPFLMETAYDKAAEKAEADAGGNFQPVVTIDALNIAQATVHYTDLSNPKPFSTTISRLDLMLENFGLNSDRVAAYHLTATTDADEALSLKGTASLTPLQAAGDISLTDINIPRYAPYFEDRVGFRTASGHTSLGGRFRFHQAEESSQFSLSGIHVTVETLNLLDKASDAAMLSLGRLAVADTTFDLNRRDVSVGRLSLDDTQLFCRREKDGTLNLVAAFVPPSAKEPETAGAPADPGVASPTNDESAPFVVALKKLAFSDLTVDMMDLVPDEPVHLRMDKLSLSATDLSTAPGQTGRADLAFDCAEEGRLQVGGRVTINPLALDLAVDIGSMDMRPFQPYLSEHAGLILTHGLFNTHGRLRFSLNDTSAPPVIGYAGDVEIGGFASIDRKNADDFLKWETLHFNTLKVNVNPMEISVDQIRMDDFFARVIIDPQGSLNLITMNRQAETPTPDDRQPDAEEETTAVDPNDKPKIRIDQIQLSGGDVDFSDQFIKPNFSARFEKLEGQISGLASIKEKQADVLLEGMWGSHAPVKISGQINPLIDDPFMDLGLTISDIELSPFSPYSGKYIGYILEKGKLTFNVDYYLENRILEGKNSISINQLTLGDEVDSPDAVSLPIKLAIALLKDREGNIQMDLPVSGSLDDPQFKIGKVILTVLKNLIVKIVSSPFAALGSLAGGGGEELSHLVFDAGDSALNAENSAKLDKLAKILYERPALRLDIQGTLAPQADEAALQTLLLENRLKSQKLQQMMKAGKSAVPLETVTISEEERAALLSAVFDAAGIPTPKDDNGKPIELTPSIMEPLLREHITVTENDYRKLANTRAFNAKDYLLNHGQVDRSRLFIVEPRKENAESTSESGASGQVIFNLT